MKFKVDLVETEKENISIYIHFQAESKKLIKEFQVNFKGKKAKEHAVFLSHFLVNPKNGFLFNPKNQKNLYFHFENKANQRDSFYKFYEEQFKEELNKFYKTDVEINEKESCIILEKNLTDFSILDEKYKENAEDSWFKGDIKSLEQWNKLKELGYNCIDGEVKLQAAKLTTLVGLGIRKTTGNVFLMNNELTSLEGGPKECYGFYCGYNKLKTLIGAPQDVKMNFDVDCNELESLEGCPERIGGDFSCIENNLTSLRDGPIEIGYNNGNVGVHLNTYECSGNYLTTLKGLALKGVQILQCAGNNLTSFEGCTDSIKELNCSNNYIVSLKGFPPNLRKITCGIKAEELTPEEFFEYAREHNIT